MPARIFASKIAAGMRDKSWLTALGGMAALAAAIGVGRFVYTPILPAMAETQHLTTGQAGLIASANLLGYLAGALLAAAPIFRGARRTFVSGALAVNALTLFAMGLTTDFSAHLVLRFIGGAAGAFVLVYASALVLDGLAASGRARLSSVHFAGVGLGITISAAVVAVLTWKGAGWQDLWLASGFLGLIGWMLAARLLPADAVPQPPANHGEAASAPFALKAVVAAYGLFGFGYVITATFLVTLVRSEPAIRTLEPYVWVLFGLTAIPSVAIWTRTGARFGVLSGFAVACLVETAGVAASVTWISAAGILTALICLGGTFMGLTALGLIAARQLSSGDPRRNIALMTAAFGAGQAIGPTFAGLLFDRLGSFFAPSLAAAGALILAAGLAWLAARARKPGRTRARCGKRMHRF